MSSEPPLRHWWLLALHKTVRYIYDYDQHQYDQPGEAVGATVKVEVEPAAVPPQQE